MIDAGATVLRDVSISLGSLIRARVFFEAPGDVEVEYHSPSAEDVARQGLRPLVLVYLFRVTDNPYLRNSPPSLVKTDRGYDRVAAPAVVDLLYLITAYAQNAETELILIDQIKRLFSDVTALQGELLKGALHRSGNELLGIVPDDLSFQEMHDLWASFPNKAYHLSLYYLVTPVRIPRSLREPVDRVLQISTTYELQEGEKK